MSTHFTDDVVKDHTAKGDNVIDPLVPRYMMATKTKEIIIDSDTKNIINDKISKISPRTTGKTSSTFNELPRYMQPTKALTSKFDRGHVEGKMPIKPRMKAIIHAPKVTIPQPFHFRSDERAHGRERQVQRSREIDKDSGRNQTIKKHKSVDLDECKKQFSAMKMPSFSTPSIIVNKKTLIKQNRTIVPTTSSYGKKNNTNNTLNSGDKPFHLRCLERHDALQNELKVSRELKEKQERHQNFFRARPMPDSSKVYNVKKSDNPRVVSEKTNALNSGKNATKLRQQLRRKDPRQAPKYNEHKTFDLGIVEGNNNNNNTAITDEIQKQTFDMIDENSLMKNLGISAMDEAEICFTQTAFDIGTDYIEDEFSKTFDSAFSEEFEDKPNSLDCATPVVTIGNEKIESCESGESNSVDEIPSPLAAFISAATTDNNTTTESVIAIENTKKIDDNENATN